MEEIKAWMQANAPAIVDALEGPVEQQVIVDLEARLGLAQQGYADGIAMSGVSGRVFSWAKDSPAVELLASTLEEYLQMYLTALRAGEYELQEGFSDHGYYLG